MFCLDSQAPAYPVNRGQNFFQSPVVPFVTYAEITRDGRARFQIRSLAAQVCHGREHKHQFPPHHLAGQSHQDRPVEHQKREFDGPETGPEENEDGKLQLEEEFDLFLEGERINVFAMLNPVDSPHPRNRMVVEHPQGD